MGYLDPEGRRKKTLNNKKSSTKLLKDMGIGFESKNEGVHLIVNHLGRIADFWPTTGKYKFRDAMFYGRGIFNMLGEFKNGSV